MSSAGGSPGSEGVDSFWFRCVDVREDEAGKDGGATHNCGGNATPMGLVICLGGTQGRPACRSPTLGSGTQSRWDWGEAEVKWAVLGDPGRCSGLRCSVGTRGEGERGDERVVGGCSPGLWQGGDGLYGGAECVKGKETGLLSLRAIW